MSAKLCLKIPISLVLASTMLFLFSSTAFAVESISKNEYGKYVVSFGENIGETVEPDGLYCLFVVKGEYEIYNDNEEYEYNYINQVVARICSVSFTFQLNENVDSTVFISSNKFDSPKLVGYIKFNKVSSVSVPENLALEYKVFSYLQPTIQPNDASDYSAVWTSNNESIVTVNEEGKIQAVARPNIFKYLFNRSSYSANITCTVTDNITGEQFSDSCTVSVIFTIWQLLFPFLF